MHFTRPFQNPSPHCRIPSKIIEPIPRWDIEYIEQAPGPLFPTTTTTTITQKFKGIFT